MSGVMESRKFPRWN